MSDPASDYADWKRKRPDVACLFAPLIATKPDRYGQVVQIVGAKTPNGIAKSVAARVDKLIADDEIAAAALIFPKIETLDILAAGLSRLSGHPGWKISSRLIKDPSGQELVAIGLTREIPFKDGTVPSEALIFGPFNLFPTTRRAPVCALEIFVGQPQEADPKTHGETTKANLAHIVVSGLPEGAFGRMWNRSGQRRLKSLGGVDDLRAKAKVAFVIPPDMAKALGLEP